MLKIDSLSKNSFKQFGKIVEIPKSEPTKSGEGWSCWNYVETMEVDTDIYIGYVNTFKRDFIVDSMERHDSRKELLMPLDGDIIQPVATYNELYNPYERPKIENVKCFYIKQGTGIILNKGIWHSPAYPVDKSTTYIFAIENKKDRFGDEIINPFKMFEGNKIVTFSL